MRSDIYATIVALETTTSTSPGVLKFTESEEYVMVLMPMLVDLYMAGQLKLDELVSRTFSLEEINTAFDVLDREEVARSIIRYT